MLLTGGITESITRKAKTFPGFRETAGIPGNLQSRKGDDKEYIPYKPAPLYLLRGGWKISKSLISKELDLY